MELRQLIYFDAVVRHGGFTRAAEHLHVAQPAVSAQIRRLESELGVTLLARTTRRVRMTQAGELFWARVRRVLDELAAARADLARLTEVLGGRVRIGAIQALDPFDLSGALAEFHTHYPGVELVLRSGPLRYLLIALDADELDLGIGPIPSDLPDRFAAHQLFSEELVIITAPSHPFSRRSDLPLETLRDEPFICLPPDSGLRAILDGVTARAGFTPRVPFESTNLQDIRALVSRGLGIALLARSVASAPGLPVSIHSVHPTPVHRAIGLIHHGDRPLAPAADACKELLAHWHDHSRMPRTR
ncbi:MAG: LysR family transcriptional regulator [Actinomycetota bacterium]|nr:LysR family transcriptional regulator [Actinomycetota bacterium]